MKLYTTPATDRFFLVPRELPAGDFEITGADGDRLVDPEALAPYEVSREQAEAHVRLEIQQAVTAVADGLTAALGQGSTDLARVAQRLGLTGGDRAAAEAAFSALPTTCTRSPPR